MPSPFQGIDIASSALSAFNQGLNVTGNNIANVNTPGYSEEQASFQGVVNSNGSQPGFLALGNGVTLSSVNRVRNLYLDSQMNSVSSSLGQTNSLLGGSQQIQSQFNEPGPSGVQSSLDSFFNSWSALAANPSNAGLLSQVQQSGETLASRVRDTYANLSTLQSQNTQQIQSTITQIQGLANQVSTLNKQILSAQTSGAQPNQLEDQRTQALQQLSGLVDINVQTSSTGEAIVYVNQFNLVNSTEATKFPTNFNSTTSQVTDANGTYDIRSGQLAGLMQNSQAITSNQTQLDALANTLRTSVNSIEKTGINGLGNPGQNFFNDASPQTGAINFDLDPAVIANPEVISAGTTGSSGDGTLALSISQVNTQVQASLGNQSINSYYQNIVSTVGTQVQSYQNQQSTQNALQGQVTQQIQSTSGVNLDEEMTAMLKYQQSYQAAAKALNIADQTVQDLISMVQ